LSNDVLSIHFRSIASYYVLMSIYAFSFLFSFFNKKIVLSFINIVQTLDTYGQPFQIKSMFTKHFLFQFISETHSFSLYRIL